MPDYRRYYLSGSPVFITSVTHERRNIFTSRENIQLLWDTIHYVKRLVTFDLLAHVILPDHVHLLLLMPNERPDFSIVLQKIKWNFTWEYKKANHISTPVQIWQRGFWDHVIRDEDDLAIHLDYIHWNPVKHQLVSRPEEWRDSSFFDWVERGFYTPLWGDEKEIERIRKLNFE